MPEQDFDPLADRFSEMRRLLGEGNQQAAIWLLIEEVEEAANGRGARWRASVGDRLQELAEMIEVGVTQRRMTRQDIIGGGGMRVKFEDERLPVEVTTKLAEQGVLVEYPEGSPAHLAELRAALAEARTELGNLYVQRHEFEGRKKEVRSLRNTVKALRQTAEELANALGDHPINAGAPGSRQRGVKDAMMLHRARVLFRHLDGEEDDDG